MHDVVRNTLVAMDFHPAKQAVYLCLETLTLASREHT